MANSRRPEEKAKGIKLYDRFYTQQYNERIPKSRFNLFSRTLTLKPLTNDQAISIIEQLLKITDDMHVAGMIHGGIKIENIIVVESKGELTVKYVDSEFAIKLGEENDGALQGKQVMWAPEIAAMGMNPAIDVYALGMVLRELVGDRWHKERMSIRDTVLRSEQAEQWSLFLQAEFFLNVSIPDAHLTGWFAKLTPFLSGLTCPVHERISLKKARALLLDEEFKEEENRKPDHYSYRKGLDCLHQITDKSLFKLIYEEVKQELAQYIRHLQRECDYTDEDADLKLKDSVDFLSKCSREVSNQKLNNLTSAYIACLSEVIVAEKRFVKLSKSDSSAAQKKQIEFRESRLSELKGENVYRDDLHLERQPNPILVEIHDLDPTKNLSELDKRLLDRFLQEQIEKEAKSDFNHAILMNDVVYPVDAQNSLYFSNHILTRQPKIYDALEIIGSDEAMPSLAQRTEARKITGKRKLYIKKNENGNIDVCGAHDQPKSFVADSNEYNALNDLLKIDSNTGKNKTVTNADMIKKVQVLGGYPEYVINVHRVDKKAGAGAFAQVFRKCGKLQFINKQSTYIPVTEHRERGPRKRKVTKLISVTNPSTLNDTVREGDLLRDTPGLVQLFATKPLTFQANADKGVAQVAVTLNDVGPSEGDGASGGELRKIIDTLTARQRIDIFKLALQAISELHAIGIIHRDIKPANMMVVIGGDGTVRQVTVIDYGLSVKKEKLSNSFSGTPYYFSPEYSTSNYKLTAAHDAYGLNLLLRELCGDHYREVRSQDFKAATEGGSENWYLYLMTQYYLNISIPAAQLPPEFKRELGDQAVVYEKILNEMSQAAPGDRMLPGTALKLLMPDYEFKEDKNSESSCGPGAFESFDSDKALFCIGKIKNPAVEVMLYKDAYRQLEEYIDSQKRLQLCENSDKRLAASVRFLTVCQQNLVSLNRELEKHPAPWMIVWIASIVFEEKNLFADEKLSEKQRKEKRELKLDEFIKKLTEAAPSSCSAATSGPSATQASPAVTPPSPISQGFAADPHPSPSGQPHDTQEAASGSYRRSGPG